MVFTAEKSDRLIEFLLCAEAVDLNEASGVALVGDVLFGFFEVRRQNRVNHVQLVLQGAVLLLQLSDSLSQLLFGRHALLCTLRSCGCGLPNATRVLKTRWRAKVLQPAAACLSAALRESMTAMS